MKSYASELGAAGAKERSAVVESAARALMLLNVIVEHCEHGIRYSDLCTLTGYSEASTHRMLKTLCEFGYAEQEYHSRMYYPGPMFLNAAGRLRGGLEIQAVALPTLQALSKETNDTIFLSTRRGMESVCVAKIEGTYPIKALNLEVGMRRPLGFGAGATVLLAFAPVAERKIFMQKLPYRRQKDHQDESARLLQQVSATESLGYCYDEGSVLKGMASLAVPIVTAGGRTVAAISLSATTARLKPSRREVLLGHLRTAAQSIAEDLAQTIAN